MNPDIIKRLKKAQGVGPCLKGDPRYIKNLCAEAAQVITELEAQLNEASKRIAALRTAYNIGG